MHIGALVIFEGAAPAPRSCSPTSRAACNLVPRYRQRLAHTRSTAAGPLWVDDRPLPNGPPHQPRGAAGARAARPTARSARADLLLGSSIAADRCGSCGSSRAWRTARFALIFKSHHALIDGIAGVDLATVVFDLDPAPRAQRRRRAWQPAPSPGSPKLLAAGAARHRARRAARRRTAPRRRARPAVGRSARAWPR